MNRELTVAQVRGLDDAEAAYVQVLFLESARIYLLARVRPDFEDVLTLLREGERVRIATVRPDGDLIDDVEAVHPDG
jgi:hypothetical protein